MRYVQVDTIREGEVEVDETHPSSVDEQSVETIGEEVLPEGPKIKSGWQKWGKGYIWTRGGHVGTSTLEEEEVLVESQQLDNPAESLDSN